MFNAQSTNEDLYALARLAFDHLHVGKAYIAGLDQGWSDDILVSADKNPNTAGAMAIGAGRLRSLLDLSNDLKAGAITALLVVGTQGVLGEGAGAAAALPLDRLQALVAIGTHKDASPPRPTSRCRWPRGPRSTARSPTSWAWSSACAPPCRPPATRCPAGRSCRTWRASWAPPWTSSRPKAVFAEAKQKLPFMKEADWGRADAAGAAPLRELARLDASTLGIRQLGFRRSSTALVKILFMVLGFLMPLASILTWLERRQSAMMQDRLGPNRANIGADQGAWGITHFLADAVKFIFKEDYVPGKAHKFLFMWAPIMAMAPALIVAAIIPFGPPLCWGRSDGDSSGDARLRRSRSPLQIARLDIGLLFYFAISSLAVYGATLAGWASHNKWAMMGGLRASSQMMSYEVTMGMAVLGAFLVFGTLEPGAIVAQQTPVLQLRATSRRAGASSCSRSASSCS